MLVERYKKVSEWLKDFLSEKPPEATTHRLCVSVCNKELKLIHINRESTKTEILLAESSTFDGIDNIRSLLTQVVREYELEEIPTFWLLSTDDYQMFIIETLAVPEDEFDDALNWRISSLINYPILESSVDYINLPGKKASDKPMIAAAVSRKEYLKSYIDAFKYSGLYLTNIYIPELAMRNLTSLYETDEKSTAFIYFLQNIALLNLTSNKVLYFTRRITLTMTEPNKINYENLSLDILRYFDYFQSQWRRAAPTRIFIASQLDNIAEISEMLSKLLLIKVEPYTIPPQIISKDDRNKIEKHFLLNFGCALREDS